jgi:NTP pyrophosphatase (non-canonical NTP hydrolase)
MGEIEYLNAEFMKLAKDCLNTCKKRNWKRDWSHGGCYLHLEVSEFIESLRGKGDSTPEKEASDVLFALLSVMEEYKISIPETLKELRKQLEE